MNNIIKNRKRLSNDFAIEEVKRKCYGTDYSFVSFCDSNGNKCDYENQLTHVKLYCKKCKKEWFSATYNRFIHGGTGCPNCKRIKEDEALFNIQKLCKNLGYTFLNFCNKNGVKSEWGNVRNTYLHLKCNKCGNEWTSCSYTNFVRGRKCPKCKSFFKSEKLENFMKKCIKNKWEIIGYVDNEYKNTTWEKCIFIKLKCLICGNIWHKNVNSSYSNSGCPNCAKNLNALKKIKNEDECLSNILDLCRKRQYEFLGYCNKNGENCHWYGSSTYLKLKCLVCGGIWNTCTYYNFTHNLRGCPKCKKSHLENEVANALLETGIKYESQKHFDWLGQKTLDFYLPEKNLAIECQGRQHFEPVATFGGVYEFENIQNRDAIKKQLCDEHGINIIYYSNLKIKYPYEVINNIEKLLKKITE